MEWGAPLWNGEHIFATDVTNKVSIKKIYKQFIKLKNRK